MADRLGPRYGIVADVHSNLQALLAVLAYLSEEGVDEIYCLGDVVGYGGDPQACVSLVRKRCEATVRGNHDHAVVDASLREWFNPHARQAIERQGELLSEDDVRWLAALPPTVVLDDVIFGHAGFVNPDRYYYVTSLEQARAEFEAFSQRWGFIGHTHVMSIVMETRPGEVTPLFVSADRTSWFDASAARVHQRPVAAPSRYLINPGAVGQPRDRDPRASCAVLDVATSMLKIARLPYDISAAQEAIRRSGMPPFEAHRLMLGI